jgi:sulfur-oxidizing protein SoxZ
MAINARLSWSASPIKKGDLVALRLIVQHPMETGYLQDLLGRSVARNVINHIKVSYEQNVIFEADTSSGIAANPFFEFYVKANETGAVQVDWVDDAGVKGELNRILTVVS